MLTEQEKPLVHIKDMQDILDIRFVYRILSVQRDLIGQVRRLGCLGYEVNVVTEKGGLNNQVKTIWNDRLGRNVMFVIPKARLWPKIEPPRPTLCDFLQILHLNIIWALKI